MITVVSVVKNEEIMLPFFFRHYERFVDRFIIIDNGSTDRTGELAKAHPKTDLSYLETNNEFKDSSLVNIKNIIYQYEVGDWFIIVDCDEFIWHPDVPAYLKSCESKGVTLPKTEAFDMIGTEVPVDDGKSQLWQLQNKGIRRSFYDKFAVVHKTVKVNYRPGCHQCDPTGDVKYSIDADLTLLHYAWLSEEYRIKKAEENAKAMCRENKEKGWSSHYLDIPGLRDYYRAALEQRSTIERLTK